jgi:uncharacterized ferredoxin-like protein
MRHAGHDVYDFTQPAPGRAAFAWSMIDPSWPNWTVARFREEMNHPLAVAGFTNDYNAMRQADCCVLISADSARTSHMQAGYFLGAKKPLYILLSHDKPELLYRAATAICLNIVDLLAAVGAAEKQRHG